MTLLVGDIGGTNGRFGLVDGDAVRPRAVRTLANDGFATFEDEVAAYLDAAPERPDRAVLAVAGPVFGDAMRLTNRDWLIDGHALERRFGLTRVALVNDFVAQAAALPHYSADELTPIGEATPIHAPKAALGPGTGLGVAGLRPAGGGWIPAPSEGGHIELAAIDSEEFAILQALRRDFGRVSAEWALSGPGLARLHAAAGAVAGRGDAAIDTAEVRTRAEAGDVHALASVALYLRLLARFAGDMALTLGAQGGVYLCGGVVPRLSALIDPAAFRAAFEAKRPHDDLMRRTATVIVTSDVAGLIGCAALAGPAPERDGASR
ncbi:glucokinase [Methylopila jiangsuensis]|uniref:Glucokinase n=1 Tax=Methylopila jiangsuensis TaxID=586230 RepID=A0A9W6N284_9HYPH|nr:glucokinase [Methylopila jiangsuensis]MDR6287429.1 glucokinase [Methylopila jiangsuensis]GLK75010.1 glucokinase [Methylopila jiangsuensis]